MNWSSPIFPYFFPSCSPPKTLDFRPVSPHQELLKVKLVRAAQKALEVARKNNGGYNKAQALAAAAFVEVSELKTKWSLVQTFQQKQEMGWWDEGATCGHQGWHGEILDGATCEVYYYVHIYLADREKLSATGAGVT